MPTYTATMTIMPSILCPSEWSHSFTRSLSKVKPGIKMPSKGGAWHLQLALLLLAPMGEKENIDKDIWHGIFKAQIYFKPNSHRSRRRRIRGLKHS